MIRKTGSQRQARREQKSPGLQSQGLLTLLSEQSVFVEDIPGGSTVRVDPDAVAPVGSDILPAPVSQSNCGGGTRIREVPCHPVNVARAIAADVTHVINGRAVIHFAFERPVARVLHVEGVGKDLCHVAAIKVTVFITGESAGCAGAGLPGDRAKLRVVIYHAAVIGPAHVPYADMPRNRIEGPVISCKPRIDIVDNLFGHIDDGFASGAAGETARARVGWHDDQQRGKGQEERGKNDK